MDVTYLSPTDAKIGEKLDLESTFEENFEDNKEEMEKQSPLYHILEKQAKELEEFGRRMTLELQTSYNKQQQEQTNEDNCHECIEKSKLIHTLRTRIDELENDARVKDQDIKKLQRDVRSLFDIIVKKGQQPVEKTNSVQAKITITTEIDGTINEVEEEEEEEMYYNDNIKDSYSDSAIDLFTDDDDYSSINGGSVKSDEEEYVGRPSEWLDVSHSYRQRPKVDKKNLDRWNSKMASNGLLPIRLVGKVDAEKEKKYQTHRKGYSTSAIWLKTYENTRKKLEKQNQEDKFKLPSFKFSFGGSTTPDGEKKESKGTPAPISLKSSVSTSVSELTTCSVTTTSLASNTLKPYEAFHKEQLKNNNTFNSSQLLSSYK